MIGIIQPLLRITTSGSMIMLGIVSTEERAVKEWRGLVALTRLGLSKI